MESFGTMSERQTPHSNGNALVGVAGLEEAHEEGVGRADRHLELERREHEGLHVDDLYGCRVAGGEG